jgi:hypothetical protein
MLMLSLVLVAIGSDGMISAGGGDNANAGATSDANDATAVIIIKLLLLDLRTPRGRSPSRPYT